MNDIKEQLADLKLSLTKDGKNLFHEKILTLAPAIIVHVESGTIVFATDSVNAIFNYLVNELEGKEVSDLMPAEFKVAHERHLKNYLKEPKQRNMGLHGMVLKGKKKTGEEFNIKISLSPFVEDGVLYAVGFIMEI